MVGGDRVRRHGTVVGVDRDPHARDLVGQHVPADGSQHCVRPLTRDEPARDVTGRDMRDHGVLAPGGDAVDLERGSFPQPFQRGVASLAEDGVDAETAAVRLLVEVDSCDLGTTLRRQLRDPVVEAVHRDPALARVQAGQDLHQRVQGVGDGAAEASGVEVVVGSLDHDVERGQALRGDRERRLGGTPHRAVGRDHQVRGQLVGVLAQVRRQVGAADLLLALEEELDVEGQSALLVHEGLGHLEHDVDGALVVARPTAAHDLVLHRQLERWGDPLREVAGGLHVVVAVHQDRRCAGPAQPVRAHHGVSIGGDDTAAGEGELRRQPLGGRLHRLRGRVPADARDRDVAGQLGKVGVVVRVKGEHGRRRSRWSDR